MYLKEKGGERGYHLTYHFLSLSLSVCVCVCAQNGTRHFFASFINRNRSFDLLSSLIRHTDTHEAEYHSSENSPGDPTGSAASAGEHAASAGEHSASASKKERMDDDFGDDDFDLKLPSEWVAGEEDWGSEDDRTEAIFDGSIAQPPDKDEFDSDASHSASMSASDSSSSSSTRSSSPSPQSPDCSDEDDPLPPSSLTHPHDDFNAKNDVHTRDPTHTRLLPHSHDGVNTHQLSPSREGIHTLGLSHTHDGIRTSNVQKDVYAPVSDRNFEILESSQGLASFSPVNTQPDQFPVDIADLPNVVGCPSSEADFECSLSEDRMTASSPQGIEEREKIERREEREERREKRGEREV